jgi:hypothetical protein
LIIVHYNNEIIYFLENKKGDNEEITPLAKHFLNKLNIDFSQDSDIVVIITNGRV